MTTPVNMRRRKSLPQVSYKIFFIFPTEAVKFDAVKLSPTWTHSYLDSLFPFYYCQHNGSLEMEDLSKNLIYLETQSPVSLKSLVNAGSRISQNQEI